MRALWFACCLGFASLFPLVAFTSVEVGQKAPAFSLKGSEGETHSLKDYRGKVVVLEWYNKDCPFVRKHYDSSNMQKLQESFTDKGVVWLSVISSAPGKQGHLAPKEAKENAQKEGSHASAVLLDPSGKVGKAYDAKTTPHMYIIDKEGELRYQGAIDSIPSYDQEDIPEAENYVQEGLSRLLEGKDVQVTKTTAYGCSVKY